MEENPLVSVIIPTYNRADYLVEAIQSVLGQTYTHYEILVADDGSTDDTMERVAAIAGPIHYLRLDHTGQPGVARNQALKAAAGNLIAFLDSDDLWRKDKLSKQVALFLEDTGLGLAYSDCRIFSTGADISAPALKSRQLHLESVFEELLKGDFFHPSTIVVQKSLFDRIGLFDVRFEIQADYLFWLRAARIAPARAVPESLVYVRRHAQNLSDQRGISHWYNSILMFEHLMATEALTFRQGFILRKTLARFNTHIGLHHLRLEQRSAASRYFLRSLGWNPIQRRAWLALWQSLMIQGVV